MHPSSDPVSRLVDPERKSAKDSLFCRGSMCVITLGDELQQRKHSRREGEKEEGRRKKESEELSKFIHVGEKLSKMWPISCPLVLCALGIHFWYWAISICRETARRLEVEMKSFSWIKYPAPHQVNTDKVNYILFHQLVSSSTGSTLGWDWSTSFTQLDFGYSCLLSSWATTISFNQLKAI